ncbi:MAG: hypothetical protein EOO24_59800, partial [Comamonadaceae bacterium]
MRVGPNAFKAGSTIVLDASGGRGGDGAPLPAQGEPPQPGLTEGGAGGLGGNVSLVADGGKLILQGALVSGAGGQDGAWSDGSQWGSSGAMGTFTAAGSAVDVEGAFGLDARWANGTVVNLRDASSVSGSGTFVNLGQGKVNLYGVSSLTPDGGVSNMQGAELNAFGAGTSAFLTSNTGKVTVAAGAQLAAPWFYDNQGTVQVDGTLAIGYAGQPMRMMAMAPSGFTNAATGLLTGNGTLVVDGGSGTVFNYGKIAPGGEGQIGTFGITGGLVMEPGSTLAIDIGPNQTHDVLNVSGSTTTGGAISVTRLQGATFAAGDSFAVLQTAALDATTAPTVNVQEL